MAWWIARYQPVGLFSLKHGEATSTGGKTLLIPTPFAVRTALLDAALRTEGIAVAEEAFERIRRLALAIQIPPRAAVSALFTKILKPERDASRGRAFQRTIAFREYVHLAGPLEVALGGEPEDLTRVAPWLAHVTYLGKRGGFVQLLEPPRPVEALPEGFVPLTPLEGQDRIPLGILQRVDDWGPTLTFDKLNVYSDEKIKMGKDRIRFDVVVPYRLVRSGRGFALYVHLDAAAG